MMPNIDKISKAYDKFMRGGKELMTRCYRCGKKIGSMDSFEVGIASSGDVYSREYVLCGECKHDAMENFEKFVEQDPITEGEMA